ncbi:MAG TPA: serine/threonine-protein kinase, partial [Thermoanaerobaculia bacterium]|nr:serine/threonine-protein kinase [Thermoanaerobaculia bacterium]
METGDATVRLERPTSRGPADGSQFAPGTVIGDRYRIASLLGSGGMGEVYRADDLKLHQHVALKFLPAALANDADYLEQLHGEVRLGRQVAHPNVCRVYDIGEAAGTHYIAMEYVDGEDLGRLLRRIGRLAHDKAVEIARGIAAGLAAAHAKGILHRDLKPANVMIDGLGEPRITDFGLALANEDASAANQAGTPAYMAPEQFNGAAASVQTDLYALGLVLYEIFTGRRARQATTLAELRSASGSQISLPSTVVRDIDVVVERVILRCLERDPALRPQSARDVFNALPGGDPLAAAVAAGETPSPRLVAAAGVEGTLSRRAAWSWLAGIIVMFAATLFLMRDWSIAALTPMEIAPPLLEARALDAARNAGIPPQRFRSTFFERHSDYMAWLAAHDRSLNPWKRLRTGPQPITLRLRQSPQPLVPMSPAPLIGADDPPLILPGMSDVEIDTLGHVVSVRAYPREGAAGHVDWSSLLVTAGLDPKTLKSVPPRRVPPFYADSRVAWDGAYADAPSIPLHIEGASVNGAAVWFSVSG